MLILLQILLRGRPIIFLKLFAAFSKSANVTHFFTNLFLNKTKEKLSKIELLTRGKNNKQLWHNCRKGVITASKIHNVLTKMNKILKPTGDCVNMWSLC